MIIFIIIYENNFTLLICSQLQDLHNNTQKVLKEQQETHKHGTSSLQSMYDELVK